MNLALRFLLLLTVLLTSACAYTIRENNIIYPRAGTVLQAGVSADGLWTLAPLSLTRPDGAVLNGTHFRKAQAQATVLYFGGNGLTLNDDHPMLLKIYQDLPVDIIAFDHRSYGGSTSPGEASIAQLYADGVAIFDHVKALQPTPTGALIIHGHSLGSFVTGHVATQRPVAAVVLESSATSAESWLDAQKRLAPWYIRWFVRAKLDTPLQGMGNASAMPAITAPLLVLVGENDTTTPPDMSRALFTAAATPDGQKELVIAKNANHVNASHSAEFAPAFTRLLQRVQ